MFVYERAVRFHEVDAAGLLYFPHFLSFAHEAMEAFFGELDGGYTRLILDRRLGLPTVKLESEFSAPLRYGDTARIELCLARVGGRSLTIDYRFLRASDARTVARVRHVVVCTDLDRVASTDMPDDVRRLAERHVSTDTAK